MGTTIIGLLGTQLGTQRPKQLQLHFLWQTRKHLIAYNRVVGYLQMINFPNVSFKPADSAVR